MKLLLDTCTFLWIATDARELSKEARRLFQSPENEVYLSSVSAWEIVVKNSLGRLPLPGAPESYLPKLRRQHAIDSLPLEESAALHLSRLPALHRDPFDRMLVSQASAYGMVILTPDKLITQYPIPTAW